MTTMMMNGAGRVLSPGEVIEDDIPSQAEAEYRPQLAIKLICQECQLDPPNLIEEYVANSSRSSSFNF
jgi:transcription initiation factor TFIIB